MPSWFRQLRSGWLVLLAVVACSPAGAQDRRTVDEPRFPPVCRSVDARIALVGDRVPADAEAALDTIRIQKAIDACAPGSGVELRASGGRSAFVSGPLELRTGVTLIVGAGAVLFASRDPRVFDVRPGSCGIVDDKGGGCRPLVHVAAKDTGVMGEGAIDGRGGATLLGQQVTWWDLAEQARTPPRRQNVPRILVAEGADNLVLYRIALRNSPNFHVAVYRTRGFTAWGVTIEAPARGARNTDGIDPSSSSDVTIAHSKISTGDDQVAIKAGSAGPSTHITVAHNRFYSGHGMSIGSETNGGVSDVLVRDLTIDGSDNGLRIKSNPSRGGAVRNVRYTDVCIRDTEHPIVLESAYDKVTEGSLVPVYGPILFEDVRIAGGGASSIDGADAAHAADLIVDGMTFQDGARAQVAASHVRFVFGPGRVDLAVDGPGVTVRRVDGDRTVPACDRRFVPFEK